MDLRLSRRQMVGATAALPFTAALPALARLAKPGLDRAKLDKIPAALQAFVDQGNLSGIVTMVCHRGEIVQVNTLGWRDIESRSPMQLDMVVRL